MVASDSSVSGDMSTARRLLKGLSRSTGARPAGQSAPPPNALASADDAPPARDSTLKEDDRLTSRFRIVLLLVFAILLSGSVIVGIGALQASGDYLSTRLNGAFSIIILLLTLLIGLEVRKVGVRALARTLASRPDEETGQIYARFLIGFFCLSYIVGKGLTDGVGARGVQASIAVVGFLCSYGALLFWWMIKRPGISHKRRCTAVVFDLMSTTVALHLGGEYSAPFFGVYLWVILGNGFRYGIPYLIFAAVVGTVGFAAVMGLTPFWRSSPGLGFGLLATLIIIPIYVGKLIKQLHAATAEAEAASQAKSRFLAAMSHELRTPLNAIIGFSEMMRADLGDEARLESHRGYVQDIHTAGMHLSALVTEVLEYARIAAGQVDLRESELDLGPCIDDSVSMVRHTLEEKALRLERDLSDDFPRLRADGTKLRQVLINLLSNATKFTAPGGRIAVEAFVAAEGELAIDVVDTGAGIAEADLARVMMPFGRGEGAGQGHYGGAGLGLPISRALIEQHGGSLALDSTLGVGTRVSIRLPAGRAVVRNPG